MHPVPLMVQKNQKRKQKRAAENSKKREEKAYAENRSPDSSGGLAQKKI